MLDACPRGIAHAARLGIVFLLLGCGQGGSRSSSESAVPGQQPADSNALLLLFTYGSEKEGWIQEVTAAFNAAGIKTAGDRAVQVEAVAQGSGELVDDILAGIRQPHLVSPASAAFLQRGNALSRARTGKDLVSETRNLVLSPVVIAMWRPMAESLGWGQKPVGWGEILALARNPAGWAAFGHPEWGAFRLGHTHPEYSNSGLISLLAEVYAGAGKVGGLRLEDVAKPEVSQYLAGIESAIVHYGSSTGFFGKRMFAGGPGYLSAAVLYENMVIESYSPEHRLPFPIVAIYPKEGTFWSDHPVGVVEREWVTPEHREAAKLYVDYLLARPQQERALQLGFRPAEVEMQLTAPFDAAHGVDPREPQTTLEVPSGEVIEAVMKLWQQHKKHSDLTLVLDVSGSMNDESKLENARGGAEQLLALLDPEDNFSLLTFNSETSWALRGVPLATQRETALRTVRGLFASGGTALYDAIGQAYDDQRERARSRKGQIAAIVVLTDGEDTDSALKLPALLAKIRGDRERGGLRVFTIGYGRGSQKDVLEAIAEASQAKSFQGTPENIRAVFREIATFF